MTEEETFRKLSLLSRELVLGCICKFPASDSELLSDLSLGLQLQVTETHNVRKESENEIRDPSVVSDAKGDQLEFSSKVHASEPTDRETDIEDSVLLRLSTLAMLWDSAHPQCHGISTSPSVCGRIAKLNSLLMSAKVFKTLSQLLHSPNQFIRSLAVRCISRICLDALEEWQDVLSSFIESILDCNSVEVSVSVLDVLLMILKHSHNSIHPHHQELVTQPTHCANTKPSASVTCSFVQKELINYLQISWEKLINIFLLEHLKNIPDSDTNKSQHLTMSKNTLIKLDSENISSEIHSCSEINQIESGEILSVSVNSFLDRNQILTLIMSFLRLWKVLIEKAEQDKKSRNAFCYGFYSEKNASCILHCLKILPELPSMLSSMFLDIILRFVSTAEFDNGFIIAAIIEIADENWLEMLYKSNSVPRGFGGPKLFCPNQNKSYENCVSSVFRKACLLILRCLSNSFVCNEKPGALIICSVLSKFLWRIKSICGSEPWLIKLFEEHDDDLSDALLYCLDLYLYLKQYSELSDATVSECISHLNPHFLWIDFAKSIAYDHQVILDILTSGDNSFLVYFIRYLKLMAADLSCEKESVSQYRNNALSQLQQYSSDDDDDDDDDVDDDEDISDHDDDKSSAEEHSCGDSSSSIRTLNPIESVTDTIPLLTALRSSINRLHGKDLFPFNPVPLLRLLTQCCE